MTELYVLCCRLWLTRPQKCHSIQWERVCSWRETQISMNKQSQSPPKAQPEPLASPPDSPLLPRLQPSEANSSVKRVSSGASNVPRRKSVSNTNAFVNINGSPVRITKVNNLKGKQRSVRDLFQAIVLKSPERAVSAAGFLQPAADASQQTLLMQWTIVI